VWWHGVVQIISWLDKLSKCGVRENSTEQCSICDDQQKINELLLHAYTDSKVQLHNTTTWTIPPHTLDHNVFWKQSITGHWGLTGHTFKIWDVDTAYRGPMPTVDDQCPGKKQRNGTITPTENWVAMPENTLSLLDNRKLSLLDNRKVRLREWFEQCEHDKLKELEVETSGQSD
jgi:hypothetical protein